MAKVAATVVPVLESIKKGTNKYDRERGRRDSFADRLQDMMTSQTLSTLSFHNEERKKEGKIKKKVRTATGWREVTASLTRDSLFFSVMIDGQARILDQLPVEEIESSTFRHKASEAALSRQSEGAALKGLSLQRQASTGPRKGSQEMKSIEEEERERELSFVIFTTGKTSATQVVLMAESDEEKKEWLEALHQTRREYFNDLSRSRGLIYRFQNRIRQIYFSQIFQGSSAGLIMLNFVINVVEAEWQWDADEDIVEYLEWADKAFTCLFAFELMMNMLGTLFWTFVIDPWNWFECVVIGVALAGFVQPSLSNFNSVRILRAFKALRVLNRFHSLKMIIHALLCSVMKIVNACFIMTLVTAIYGIIGVGFWSDITTRFKTWTAACFTMFQVCTGDNWIYVLREVNPNPRWGFAYDTEAAAFFMSYFIICAWILLNAVLAVMIDEFIEAARKSKDRYEKQKAGLISSKGKDSNLNALDPLLEWLMCEIKDKNDLLKMVSKIYQILDRDGRGACSFEDIYFGLKHLVLSRMEEMEKLGAAERGALVQLTRDDLVDALYGNKEDFAVEMQEGDVTFEDFRDMLVQQLRDYVHFIVSSELKFAAFTSAGQKPSLAALKFLCMDVEEDMGAGAAMGAYAAPKNHQFQLLQQRQDRLEQMLELTMKHLGVAVPPPVASPSQDIKPTMPQSKEKRGRKGSVETATSQEGPNGSASNGGAGGEESANGDGTKGRRAARRAAKESIASNGENGGASTATEEAVKGGNDSGSTPPPTETKPSIARSKSRRERRRGEKVEEQEEE